MTEVDCIVAALKMVETGADKPDFERYWEVGDDGQALGPWQLHPAFFIAWWAPKNGVTWQSAFEDAVTRFVAVYLANHHAPEDIAQIFNLGFHAFRDLGKRNPGYAEKFMEFYNRLGGSEG